MKMNEKDLVHIALMAALIAVLGLVPKLDLVGGVPVTAQSMGVMLCGLILGSRRGALAVFLFLLCVAIGLPLLSGGRGGLAVFQGATVGYLIGYPIAAFVTGFIFERFKGESLAIAGFAASVVGGIIALYPVGVAGLVIVAGMDVEKAIAAGVIPFIIGDLIKAGLAAGIVAAVANARPQSLLSRS